MRRLIFFLSLALSADLFAEEARPAIPDLEKWFLAGSGFINFISSWGLDAAPVAKYSVYLNPANPQEVGRVIHFQNGMIMKEWTWLGHGDFAGIKKERLEHGLAISVDQNLFVVKRKQVVFRAVELSSGTILVFGLAIKNEEGESDAVVCLEKIYSCYLSPPACAGLFELKTCPFAMISIQEFYDKN